MQNIFKLRFKFLVDGGTISTKKLTIVTLNIFIFHGIVDAVKIT